MELTIEETSQKSRAGLLFFLFLFGVAMAYFEAAIVVYLRQLYYPEGFDFPLKVMENHILLVEIGREAASIVMLLAVALIAGRSFYERFAFFAIIFALWDIFYYIWLKVLLGWPEGLLNWDILFLIPMPWIAPVLSPVIVSFCLIIGAALILKRLWSGGVFAPNFREWAIAVGGAFLILLSYTVDQDAARVLAMPKPYRWELLAVGVAAGFYALARCLIRTRKGEKPLE